MRGLQGAGRLIAGVLVTGGVGNWDFLPALRISPDLHAHEVAPFTVVSLVTGGVLRTPAGSHTIIINYSIYTFLM